MALSNFTGPLLIAGAQPIIPRGQVDNPSPIAPSMFDYGVGLLDHRFYRGFGGAEQQCDGIGWWGPGGVMPVIDAVPVALSVIALAASQAPTAGTALTLVSSSGAGITVGDIAVRADTNTLQTGLWRIDGAAGTIAGSPVQGAPNYLTGTAFPTLAWYSQKLMIARNVVVASAGADTSATFTVRGFDIYGYPMSETITGASAATAAGKKAFKWVLSITPAGTLSGSNVTAGFGDVYGLPVAAYAFPYLKIYWPAETPTLVSASTGFVAADTTSPATGITGDVRGTYAVQSASNGTHRLTVFLTPDPTQLTTTGLFGVTQFTN